MRRWSIALLDLHANRDRFQGDTSFAELAARLRDAGHDVSLIESVLAAEPGGPDAWHARIDAYLRERRFDLAVLARAWDGATIDVVRDALGEGAQVVRVTSGVRAALDERFDHVLGHEGLEQLLAGETDPERARFRRIRPAALREHAGRAPRHLPVVSPVLLDAGASEAGRPTIAGPIPGCPFLLDTRTNPHFASLDARLEGVQTKGCSFCLDNTGAFAVPSEASVLETWLSRLRSLHAADPALHEVLLIDERPHPYLPAFFRALLDDPSLPRVELLFKSRVDWLLEHADTALAEAAALAEEHGSVLHLYLVGFESFDQFHLDLFNKGVTVADNVAAIAKMRELAARFPRSFEFRRYRTHGVVLFTPWTTPESLLENARVMREVGFSELRSQAVRTRLRLYPRVPLHALAERDGLLVDAFSEGRPDRAAEQGYDASVPWRFQHPEMEAIYQVANGLTRAHSQRDEDLLELAVHHVRRHPGLAAQPDVARLPLIQALEWWGSPGSTRPGSTRPGSTRPGSPGGASMEPALRSVDLEVELVLRGDKRACLKERVPADEVPDLCRAYRAMGLEAGIVEWHGLERGRDLHEPGEEFAIVAVAADRSTLEEVIAMRHGATASESVEAVGVLLGYPKCCIDAFSAQRFRGDNLALERLPFRRAPDEELHPLVHRTGAVKLLSHVPCSPSCAASIQLGERTLAVLASIDEAAAERVSTRMSLPVLFLDYHRRLELTGAWDGARFRVDAAVPLGDPRHLEVEASAITALQLSREGVRFTLQGGRAASVRASLPLLTEPGQALAERALFAIGGPLSGDEQADAEGPSADDTPRGAPTLPAAFRRGARVDQYRIDSVSVAGQAREIVLAGPGHSFRVRIRAHDPDAPFVLRRGPLAIDVDDPHALPDAARVALGVLVRALPAS